MKKIIYAMTFAGICAVGANALTTVNGCYQIGTYDELKEFAIKVNGGEHSACGKLTADITANSNVLSDDMKNTKSVPSNVWTPIQKFTGILDGANHTIFGLYYKASSNAGLIQSVENGTALIKNLKIRDSYIAADTYAGGFVAQVKGSGKVYLDSCSFIGLVASNSTSGSGDGYLAEMVGFIASKGNAVITNSFVEGCVYPKRTSRNLGGFVAYIQSGASLTLYNDYSTAYVMNDGLISGNWYNNNILVGKNDGGTITASNVGCKSSSIVGIGETCNDVVKANVVVKSNESDVHSVINDYDQSNIVALYVADEDAFTKMYSVDNDYVGTVAISYEDGKVVATFDDKATTFNLPYDLKVDKVVFNRKFTNTKSSTIALPFSASTSVIAGAEFYTITGVTPRDQSNENSRDTVVGNGVTSVEAYVPYLVKPTGNDGSFAVSGAVTLKKTPASQNTTVGDWSFITALEKKVWRRADEEKGLAALNEGEIGRIYGFAGAESDGFVPGNFVRVEKANIMPMRAYLKYTGNLGECGNALCKASPVVLSDSMVVRLNSIKTVDPSVGGEVTDPEEETTSIVKPFVAPVAEKANRWYDLSGRLNKKPSNRGSFYSKQAIVK
ncbi:hypothetical protein [Fibrobacter sp. UWH5]|uniref:hypothetical protein n=1 Tax=Fibrobacter sp. UWH5 TaxID=1896211 RepID=UPI001114A6B5|nr:hypothetical protein [Fibrobacter sp. UWH5]